MFKAKGSSINGRNSEIFAQSKYSFIVLQIIQCLWKQNMHTGYLWFNQQNLFFILILKNHFPSLLKEIFSKNCGYYNKLQIHYCDGAQLHSSCQQPAFKHGWPLCVSLPSSSLSCLFSGRGPWYPGFQGVSSGFLSISRIFCWAPMLRNYYLSCSAKWFRSSRVLCVLGDRMPPPNSHRTVHHLQDYTDHRCRKRDI